MYLINPLQNIDNFKTNAARWPYDTSITYQLNINDSKIYNSHHSLVGFKDSNYASSVPSHDIIIILIVAKSEQVGEWHKDSWTVWFTFRKTNKCLRHIPPKPPHDPEICYSLLQLVLLPMLKPMASKMKYRSVSVGSREKLREGPDITPDLKQASAADLQTQSLPSLLASSFLTFCVAKQHN